jgi:glutamate formiminotransferase
MQNKQLIECVPNFSEGRDLSVIEKITDEIQAVEGVKLLDVDPGKATNRTVVTFVGEPEPVIEAAFRAIKKASEVIDMSKHSGEHPRMGATDVCPLIPIANITMEEVVQYASNWLKKPAMNWIFPFISMKKLPNNRIEGIWQRYVPGNTKDWLINYRILTGNRITDQQNSIQKQGQP